MSEHGGILSDPIIWYSAALAIFAAIFYRYARKPILGWLDLEIAKVKAELDEAVRLRDEASASLAEYQAKKKDAMADAAAIIEHAKSEAVALRESAEKELGASIQRREKQAMDRISLAETEAVSEIKALIVEQAIANARASLSASLNQASTDPFADQAITAIDELSSQKPKAA